MYNVTTFNRNLTSGNTMGATCNPIRTIKTCSDDLIQDKGSGSLFDPSVRDKVNSVRSSSLQGKSSPVNFHSTARLPWFKRAWSVITFPLCWLVQKIIGVVKWMFSWLFPSKGLSLNPNTPVKFSRFCFRTVDELILLLTNEAGSLEMQMKDPSTWRNLSNPASITETDLLLKRLSQLYFTHYEVSEAFCSIDDIFQDKGKGITFEQAQKLRELQFHFNAVYLKFKQQIVAHSHSIGCLFNKLREGIDETALKNSELWFLRSYDSALKFMLLYHQELVPGDKLKLTPLDLSISNAVLEEKKAKIAFLERKVDQIINDKIQDLKKRQEELSMQEQAEALAVLGGIPNIGSSCYLNSCLQVFLGTGLRAFLDEEGGSESAVKVALKGFREIYDLEDKKLRGELISDAASDLRRGVADSGVVPDLTHDTLFDQNDAPAVLGGLLADIGYKFDLQITTTSLEGDGETDPQTNPMQVLTLPIGNREESMQMVVNQYLLEEIDDPDSLWREHQNYKNEYRIVDAIPDILVIQLIRSDNRLQKKDTKITWESDLIDLKALIDSSLCSSEESTIYRIMAYGNHIGSFDGGHHTANVRKGSKFYKCDDNNPIVPISPQKEMAEREQAYYLVLQREKE